jgi:hypothetical protein
MFIGSENYTDNLEGASKLFLLQRLHMLFSPTMRVCGYRAVETHLPLQIYDHQAQWENSTGTVYIEGVLKSYK